MKVVRMFQHPDFLLTTPSVWSCSGACYIQYPHRSPNCQAVGGGQRTTGLASAKRWPPVVAQTWWQGSILGLFSAVSLSLKEVHRKLKGSQRGVQKNQVRPILHVKDQADALGSWPQSSQERLGGCVTGTRWPGLCPSGLTAGRKLEERCPPTLTVWLHLAPNGWKQAYSLHSPEMGSVVCGMKWLMRGN